MTILIHPDYLGFEELFSNTSTMKILTALYQMDNKCGSASSIASILEIHITTAKKHLEILNKYGFLSKKVDNTKPGKPTFYTVKSVEFNVSIDLEKLSNTINYNISIPDILIREKKGIYPRIQFIITKNNVITAIKIKKRTKAKRTVFLTFNLTEDESNFLKFIPHPTMIPIPILKVCELANISGIIRRKSMYNFALKLIEMQIIELHKLEI